MNPQTDTDPVVGRFAPSPSGRMHLGNLFTALISWLSVRSRGGRWILRIEDLDPQRSRPEYARMIEDDLRWLGLDWDEGGVAGKGNSAPYMQSLRSDIYADALERLRETGFTYPCFCTRADIMASSAPHQSDGRIIYSGRCRPASLPAQLPEPERAHTLRLAVPSRVMSFTDLVFGEQSSDLARDCGDFILRRADGAWAYQLAVTVDDALMGVNEIVRGCDLISSTFQQSWLRTLLGYPEPAHAHLPLLCNASGRRLSKRDASLSAEALREIFTPGEVLSRLAVAAGMIPAEAACRDLKAADLIPYFRFPDPVSAITVA